MRMASGVRKTQRSCSMTFSFHAVTYSSAEVSYQLAQVPPAHLRRSL